MRKILAFGLVLVAISFCFAEEVQPKENVKIEMYDISKPFWDPKGMLDPGFAGFGILSKNKFKPGKPNPDFTLRPPYDTPTTRSKRAAVDDKYKVPVDPFFDPTRTIPSQIDPGFALKPPYDILSKDVVTNKPDPDFTLRPPYDGNTKVKREAVDDKYKVPVDPFFDPTRTIPSQIDPGFALKPPYGISNFEKFTSKPDPDFTLRPPYDTNTKVKREVVDDKYKVPVDPTRTVPSQIDPGFYRKPPYDISNFEKFTSKPDPGFTLRP